MSPPSKLCVFAWCKELVHHLNHCHRPGHHPSFAASTGLRPSDVSSVLRVTIRFEMFLCCCQKLTYVGRYSPERMLYYAFKKCIMHTVNAMEQFEKTKTSSLLYPVQFEVDRSSLRMRQPRCLHERLNIALRLPRRKDSNAIKQIFRVEIWRSGTIRKSRLI